MRRLLSCVLLSALLAASLAAPAARAEESDCSSYDDLAARIAEAQHGLQPVRDLPALPDLATAACLRNAVVTKLWKEAGWGKPVGYKVALTSKAIQERLGLDQPLWGVLLAGMLLPDGSSVPAAYGARPIVEADLLVTIADDAINEATTLEEAAEHLADIKPFIELADLMLAEGEPFTATAAVAINAGARLGVVGPSLPMTPELFAALPAMRVSLGDGQTLFSEAEGTALMGHPLEPLLFLIGELRAAGWRLQAGDIVSLGSFGPPQAPRAGATFTARYEGLPDGPVAIRVHFLDE